MIVVLVLWLIAGLANGLGDSIKFHDPFPMSKFWSALSWSNLYKNGNPADGPKFFLSTSLFAWMCDGWHLCKTITLICLALSAVIPMQLGFWVSIVLYLAIRIIFFIGFSLTYK